VTYSAEFISIAEGWFPASRDGIA